MKLLRSSLIILLSSAILACDSSDSHKNLSIAPHPTGMITAIRENGAWRFKIRVSTTYYNTSTSVKAKLNGKDIPSSLWSKDEVLANMNESYMNVSLSDDMVKTGVLDLWDSHASDRGDNGTTHYTIRLADLVK